MVNPSWPVEYHRTVSLRAFVLMSTPCTPMWPLAIAGGSADLGLCVIVPLIPRLARLAFVANERAA